MPTFLVNASSIISQSDFAISFYMPVGFGTGLRVVVSVGGQSSSPTASGVDRFDFDPPSVLSFVRYSVNPAVCAPPVAPTCSTVTPFGGNATTQCEFVYPGCYPTAGGFPLQLLGSSFGIGAARVLVGEYECPLLASVAPDHNLIVCTAPQGMGDSVPITVIVGGRASASSPNSTFQYDPPSVGGTFPASPNAALGGAVTISGGL